MSCKNLHVFTCTGLAERALISFGTTVIFAAAEKSPSLLQHKLLSVLHSGNRGFGSTELNSLLAILISAAFAGILVCCGHGGGEFVLEAC